MKNDFITQVEVNAKLREKLNTYENEFTRKPYLVENQNLFLLTIYAKYVFAFISIASAFYFVFTVMFNAIPVEILAILLAVVLLVILEIAKFNALPPLLKNWLKTNQVNRSWLLVNVLFIALSVYLSVKGIEKYAIEQRAIQPTLINQDSLASIFDRKIQETEKNYDQQLAQIRQDKNTFKQQIEWQGKINLYDANTAQRLAAFDQQIQTLQQQKNLRLQTLLQEKKQQMQQTSRHNQSKQQQAQHLTATNTLYLVGLAFTNEVLALLCLFYGIFYKYRSVSELDILKNYSADITLSPKDIPLLFNYLQNALQGDKTNLQKLATLESGSNHFQVEPKTEKRPSIGFQIQASAKPKQTVDSSQKEFSQTAGSHPVNKVYHKKVIVKKELPRKERYTAEERMEKNLEVVEAIRNYIRDFGKVNYTNIARNTNKDYRTVREVYQAMLILNLL